MLLQRIRLHPFIKLFLFSLVISILSCVTAPKVSEIAELHYGDDEAGIVDKLGRGRPVLYYRIDESTFHYRVYKTRHTLDEYALLFTNSMLISVAKEATPFDDCVKSDEHSDWELCLRRFTTTLREDAMDIAFHDFSEDIKKQKQKEAELTDSAVAVAVVAVPSVIVTWPFAAMCGGIIAIDESRSERSEYNACISKMDEVTTQSDALISNYLDDSDESVLSKVDNIYPMYVISDSDEHVADRRIISKRWGCGRMGSSDDATDIQLSIGIKGGRYVWAVLDSRWQK